ncbi:hypothetical protein [uncultured Nostoc sp.]|uniref:hypothetical protein n=1 Tax=uncultured Nostoc sp. TaxID=340711 RepID=UPI0026161580|nr:hypothetical protein [uncultured Nostoc sp.]
MFQNNEIISIKRNPIFLTGVDDRYFLLAIGTAEDILKFIQKELAPNQGFKIQIFINTN